MKALLRLCAAVALLCGIAATGMSPAWAALDTTTGSPIDLAPILNPLIQTAGMIMASCASVIALFGVNWVRKRMNMASIEVDAGLQAKIDAVAQKAIGGLVAKANVKPGTITFDTHSALINEAANKLAVNLGDTLTQAGSTDNVEKAREIIVNRLGMMKAAADGTPIPNPSQPESPQAAPKVVTVQSPTPLNIKPGA